jgi:hypothetical protein
MLKYGFPRKSHFSPPIQLNMKGLKKQSLTANKLPELTFSGKKPENILPPAGVDLIDLESIDWNMVYLIGLSQC